MTTCLVRPLNRAWRSACVRAIGTLCALAALAPSCAVAGPAEAPAANTFPVLAECSWDRPGHNPFMGDVVAAVDRYTDIPAPVRGRLKQRMQSRQYDEIVSIRRDRIEGKQQYGGAIRDMHFGSGSVCRAVTRAGWAAQMQERGLVYCGSGHCILVPTVCRNVSRIVRQEATGPAAAAAQGGGDAGELPFDPPGAGPAAAEGPAFPAGGENTPADSFAGLGGEARAGPLFGGDPWAPTATGAGGGGRQFDDNAAQPGRRPLPVPGGSLPVGPEPTVGPIPLPHVPIPAVPEPGTWLMFGVGLALLHAVRRPRAARSPTAR
jgi:hypothetical protein